jgi:solute carrier family 36 (proton-coupled amino acid transporter)
MSSPNTTPYQPQEGSSPQTISLSNNREGSPRLVSIARLAQSPVPSGSPSTPQQQTTPLLHDFSKLEPNPTGGYGTIGPHYSALSRHNWTMPQDEDPEIIRKHLVSGFERGSETQTPIGESSAIVDDDVPLSEQFNSLQLQGGDVTRQVYRFAEQSGRRGSGPKRSQSFSHLPNREGDLETVQDIIVPGGFRRNFIQRQRPQADGEEAPPTFLTRNFLHFLTLYGHFAGEDLEEWDEPSVSRISVHGCADSR